MWVNMHSCTYVCMHSRMYASLSVYVCIFIIDTYHTQTLSAQDVPGSLNGDLASAHRWSRRCNHAFAHATSCSIVQFEQRSLGARSNSHPDADVDHETGECVHVLIHDCFMAESVREIKTRTCFKKQQLHP